MTVNARQWTQARTGSRVPNRRGSLGGVLDARAFELAPGARKELKVTLNSVPSSGSCTARSRSSACRRTSHKRKGVVTGYRLVNALRYGPATPHVGRYQGRRGEGVGKGRALTLAVRNTGNTLDPVSGSVLKSALGTKGSVKADAHPARQERPLTLMSGNALKAGPYTATISLRQGTRRTVTKKITGSTLTT